MHKSVHCGLKRQDLHTVVIGRLGGTGFHNRHPDPMVGQGKGHMVGLHHHDGMQRGIGARERMGQHAPHRIAGIQPNEGQACQIAHTQHACRTLHW